MKTPLIPTTPTDPEPAEKAGRGSPLSRLVGCYRDARRACRPQVGDKVRNRRHSYTEEMEVLKVGKDAVEYKVHCWHDSGDDFPSISPRVHWLTDYRAMMINGLRKGREFIAANAPSNGGSEAQ